LKIENIFLKGKRRKIMAITDTYAHFLRNYLGLEEYNRIYENRPDPEKMGFKTDGVGLWVGAGVVQGKKWQDLGCKFETLDPFCPEEPTFRNGLEDKKWATENKNRFDKVVINAVMEHVNPYLLKDICDNIYKVLKKDGLLYIEYPFLWAYHPSDHRYDFGGDFLRWTKEGGVKMFTIKEGRWEEVYSDWMIPADAPDGIAVVVILRKV
jgi:SAM-dependent methyltransferase